MTAYYNEIDPYAAQWLRNLIAAGHVAPGEVDERSILDVSPDDLAGFTQCHFFAGIGVWSYALRKGGWPDSRPVWTGSCPCQPFSVAGVGGGFDDERHLWPFWFHLIEQCRPPVVFGEQVEAAIRHGWLDLVQSDLEGIGYAVAPVGIPAAGVGAPHIRQRLWFVADTPNERQHGRGAGQESNGRNTPRQQPERLCNAGRMDHHHHQGLEGLGRGHQTEGERQGEVRPTSEAGESRGVGNTYHGRRQQQSNEPCRDGTGMGATWREPIKFGETGRDLHSKGYAAGPTSGHWRDADWLLCRDGSWRPVEPGTFPLADGAPARVGRLRAYGNAIVAQVAQEIIETYMECRP